MAWFGKSQGPEPAADPSRATESDVRHAYRLFLKRDPDPDGLAHYVHRVREGLSLDELIAEFVRSDEYHDRTERERIADEQPVDLGGYQLLVPTRDPDFGSISSTSGSTKSRCGRSSAITCARGTSPSTSAPILAS